MDRDRSSAAFFVAPEVARTLEQGQIGKFHTMGGHGFAAEDANALADRLRGKRVETVGINNAVGGPDRIVNDVAIQTKYHQSACLTIRDAFDPKTGLYRYQGQMLEVPKDQHLDCVKLMRDRIARGQVPGITDPEMAGQIVRQGEVTYKQARNIARAGNIDSLMFDLQSQAVTTTYAFAIGFAVQFARSKWAGTRTDRCVQSAIAGGLATGGTSLITGVISSQILRTRVAAVGAVMARNGVKAIASTAAGRKTIEYVARGSLGKAVYGAAAANHVAKLLRTNLITAGVVIAVTTAPDFYRAAIARNISWQQFMKNGIITVAGTGAGTVWLVWWGGDWGGMRERCASGWDRRRRHHWRNNWCPWGGLVWRLGR